MVSSLEFLIENGYPHKYSSGQAVVNSIEVDLVKSADIKEISSYLPISPGTALSCTLHILVPRGPPAVCQVGRHWQRK